MAEALIRGILAAKLFPKTSILTADKDKKRLKHAATVFKIKTCASNAEAASSARIIILAVKPKDLAAVLPEISTHLHSKQLVISIAAGVKIRNLEKILNRIPVLRVMPNAPCSIKLGMTAITQGTYTSQQHLVLAKKIFGSVGKVLVTSEKHLDAITALSGSGPAFVYSFIEALIEAGQEIGLSWTFAKILGEQTVVGAAYLLQQSLKSPPELIKAVASPGGTTEAGLKILKKCGFKKGIISAIIKASQRSRQISKEFDSSY